MDGAEPPRAGVDEGLLERKTFSQPQLEKSTRMIELRTTMPGPAMKPIIDVAVKRVGRTRDDR